MYISFITFITYIISLIFQYLHYIFEYMQKCLKISNIRKYILFPRIFKRIIINHII